MFWMMLDIFSSFDPYVFNSCIPSTALFLIVNLSFLLMGILSSYWMDTPKYVSGFHILTVLIVQQYSRTFMQHLKGMSVLMTPLFLSLVSINMMGLIPYSFSLSSHLIFTLSFGLPLWLSMILSSFSKSPKSSIAHFLPDGAPDWLNPFLVLIETTSIMVRPMTLSFRLAANMSAGHIVLSLIGIYCATAWFTSIYATIFLIITTVGYIVFEMAICLIQAYIFCLLLSLYADDHAH